MAAKVPTTPQGYHTITPSLIVKDPDAALKFYAKAFGATECFVIRTSEGCVMHSEMQIGDSRIMMSGEWPDFGLKAPMPNHNSSSLMIYVADCDKAFQRAIDAGCKALQPPADMFWGDRFCKVADPFGHQWGIGTHIEEVSPEECVRRATAWKPN